MTVRWAWDVDAGPAAVDAALLADLRAWVDRVLASRRDRYLDLLSDLLRYPTVSGATDRDGKRRYREAMDACLARVEQEADRLGLAWRDHDGVAAVAEWSGRRGQHGSVGVAMHLDVVPPGGVWTHPAFGGEIIDGEVWGRGAQDDKGPVAMALAAVDVLRSLGLEPKADVRLLLGTLEETDDWPDIDLLLAREAPPEATLVPDGAFPVVVGEKGLVTIEWHATWPPHGRDGMRFVGLEGGERHNIVPAAARFWVSCPGGGLDAARQRLEALPGAASVRVSRAPPPAARGEPCLEVLFRGRAAHGAFPAHGHNALLDALAALEAVFAGRGPAAFARFLRATCAATDGSGLGLDRAHTHMGDTTVNLGVAEFGVEAGHAQANLRFPFGVHLKDVDRSLAAAARAAPAELGIEHATRGRPHEAIFLSPEDHPRLIHTLQAAYRVGTGRDPHLASLAGTTYAKVFPLALPFGPQDEGAGEPILAHQIDERVSIERHLENIRVYVLALALLAFDHDELARRVGRG